MGRWRPNVGGCPSLRWARRPLGGTRWEYTTPGGLSCDRAVRRNERDVPDSSAAPTARTQRIPRQQAPSTHHALTPQTATKHRRIRAAGSTPFGRIIRHCAGAATFMAGRGQGPASHLPSPARPLRCDIGACDPGRCGLPTVLNGDGAIPKAAFLITCMARRRSRASDRADGPRPVPGSLQAQASLAPRS